jgi:hypothetical protein
MAKALPAGRPARRRPVFGLFDGDGWAWATVKATVWLLIMILVLGYIPDRAYYFVVSRTIDLGLMAWSPVNLCPPENQDLPCPPPVGAVVPWQASPGELALPQPRTGGVAAQLGTNLLYIGGTDGTTASETTYLSKAEGTAFGPWAEGPALPEARTAAGLAILGSTAYVIGGLGPDGTPTDTLYSIGLDPETTELGTWRPVEGVTLPEARSGPAAVAVSDGIIVAGGVGPNGQPTTTVWKATLDTKGVLGAFAEQASLQHPVTDASAALEGTFLWVYGGSDDRGPTVTVQRASYGAAGASGSAQPTAGAAPSPGASAAPDAVGQWAASQPVNNLPAPRTAAAGFTSNGVLYLAGGTDGTGPKPELYWAVPDANGDLPGGWRHLDATDLPVGVADAAAVVSGVNVLLIGGTGPEGALASSYRASLAPQAPFFQLGLFGLVVPGLQIGGQIGQQLGYLAAAGVGTGNFVILVLVGLAINYRPQLQGWWDRRKTAREARAP